MITPFKFTTQAMETKHNVRTWEGLAGGKYHLVDTMLLWKDFFSELMKQRLVACDTETTGFDFTTKEIIGMSFSWSAEHSYYVPIRHVTEEKQLDIDNIREDLKEFFEDPKISTIWHNYKFDGHFILNEGIQMRGIVYDTLLMSGLLDENCSHKLKDLAKVIVHKDASKWESLIDDFRGKFGRKNKIPKEDVHYGYIPIEMMVPYAASDTYYGLMLFKNFWPQITASKDLTNLYLTETNLMKCLLDIEHEGVFIDRPYMEELGPKLEAKYTILEKEIKKVLGDINTNSPKQLVEAFQRIGIKLTKLNKSKKGFSLDANVMEGLSRKYEICKKILEYRSLVKKKSTFVDSILEKADIEDKLHCNYNQMVRTGRLCIAKGSLVQMPCDRSKYPNGVPIELVKTGDMVYSYDIYGQLHLKRVKFAGKTGFKKVVKILWQGSGHKHGGELRLTPDHRVMRTNGEWVEARNLFTNDRVMALSSGIKKCYGYNYLYARYGKEFREHRFIYKQVMGHDLDVHHIDHNKLNNNIDNLMGMTRSQHSKFHIDQIPVEDLKKRSKYLWTDEARENYKKTIKRGPEHCGWKNIPSDVLFDWAFECKGQIRKVMKKTGSDYEVLMRKYKIAGINMKDVRFMFGSKGEYISYDKIVEANKLLQPHSYHSLGIHHGKFLELCEFYDLPHNHEIISVVHDGMAEVYDLEVEDTKSFIVNEICVHNSSRAPNLQNVDKKDKLIRSSFIIPKEVKCVDGCNYFGKHVIIPSKCPKCGGNVVVEDNYILVFIDFSQMEVRFTGIMSKDPILLNTYTKTFEDTHTRTLCEVFDYDYIEASAILDNEDHPDYAEMKAKRGIGKMIQFLVIYGGTAQTLAERISTPEKTYTQKQCQVFMDAYFKKFKGVRRWIVEEKMFIRKYFQGQNAFGRWRRFPELEQLLKRQVRANKWKIERIERQWVNTQIQGSCADIFKIAMTRVYNYLRKMESKTKIIMPIHDELALYLHKDEFHLLNPIKERMEDFDFIIPLVTDVCYSTTNWADKKELKL